MAKPFDATLKGLVEQFPHDWLAQFAGPATGAVEVVDADLSTVTAQADRVLLVRDSEPWIFHLELQSSRDPSLARRMLRYHALLHHRHGLPVHSLVLLLRPEADDTHLTGEVAYRSPRGRGGLRLEFEVARLWRYPVESLLAGGIGTLPLAPLADTTTHALPSVIGRMEERLAAETYQQQAGLWTAAYILMGLRYPAEVAAQLLQGVQAMKESTTYQAILTEGRQEGLVQGRVEEARRLLLALGERRFGPPTPAVRQAVEGISTVEQLERMTGRLLDVETWEALLPGLE